MWHKVCRSDQVVIKKMGLGGFLDGGAVFLEVWVFIAKEALTGFTVQGFLTKFLSNKSVN